MIKSIIILFFTIYVVQCKIVNVPLGTVTNINTAIAATTTDEGDIMQLADGIWTGCVPFSTNKRVTIRGSDDVTFNCDGSGSLVHTVAGPCSDITLEHFTVNNANRTIIHSGYCHLSLYRINIIGAERGILALNSSVSMISGQLLEIKKGAVSLEDEAVVTIVDTLISGAVDVGYFSTFESYNTTFRSSYNDDDGGCMSLWIAVVNLNHVVFDDCVCSATNDGGAIYAMGSTLTILDSEIKNSHASRGGDLNSEGGAIYAQDDSIVTITDSRIHDCSAGYGGAVYLYDSVVMVVNNVNISNCVCTNDGGGIRMTWNNNLTLNHVRIEGCTAEDDGGGLMMEHDGYLWMTDTVVTRCNAARGGGVSIYSIWDKNTVQMTRVYITHNTGSSKGAGLYLFSWYLSDTLPTDVYMSDVVIAYNVLNASAYYWQPDGAGIYIDENTDVVMNNVTVRANKGGYGVYMEDGNITTDANSKICGNLPHQMSGPGVATGFKGTAMLCGVISSVTSSLGSGNVLFPGAVVTVDGTDMMIDENDAIVQADIVTVEISSVPFTFTLPSSRTNAYQGPLVVLSRDGVRSESADDYAFTTVACPISVTSGPTPAISATLYSYSTTVISLNFGCVDSFSVSAYFGGVKSLCTRLGQTTSYECSVPYRASAGVVSMVVEVEFGGLFMKLADVLSYEYYALPVPTSVSPNIASNYTTNVTICGLTRTAWSVPECLFQGVGQSESIQIGAKFVDDSCITCRFVSRSLCTSESLSNVRVSVYNSVFSNSYVSVRHVCAPTITSGPVPSEVIISTSMTDITISISGQFYVSTFAACRYMSSIIEPAVSITSIQIVCPMVYYDTPISSNIEVSNDGQTFTVVPIPLVIKNDNWTVCDPGYENNASRVCVLCGDGTYKTQRSIAHCTACPVEMTSHCTVNKPCTSKSSCVCNSPTLVPLYDYDVCVCPKGYIVGDYGTCQPCPIGEYNDYPGNYTSQCFVCAPGMTTKHTGSTSYEQCVCTRPHVVFDSESQTCTACDDGYEFEYFSDGSADGECIEKPFFRTTAGRVVIGVVGVAVIAGGAFGFIFINKNKKKKQSSSNVGSVRDSPLQESTVNADSVYLQTADNA